MAKYLAGTTSQTFRPPEFRVHQMIAKRIALLSVLSGALFACTAMQAAAQSPWEITFGADVIFADLTGQSELAGLGVPVNLDFNGLLNTREVGVGAQAELWKGEWGAMLDGTVQQFSGDRTTPSDGVLTKGVDELLLDAFVGRELADWAILYFGARYWDVSIDLDLSGAVTGSISEGDSWVDPVVGVQFEPTWQSGLFLRFASDIGGFNLGIGSDMAYRTVAGFGYHIGEVLTVDAEYRLLSTEYRRGQTGDADYFRYNTTRKGFSLGVSAHF